MDNNELFLRKADENDENILFEWINDKITRQNSFDCEEISPETHKKWFRKILNSEDKELFIMMNGSVPIGQIRLEVIGNHGTISYSIAEKFRGLGYGKIMLQLLQSWVSLNYDIEFCMIGLVKKSNGISKHIFESENFIKSENNEHIKYVKQIIPKQV